MPAHVEPGHAKLNGRKRIVGVACVVVTALVLGGITGGLTTWRDQSGLKINVAHAQERADTCCENSEQNARDIATIQADVQHTKEQVDESRDDIKRMDRNLSKLLGKLGVDAEEPR